MRSPPRKAVNYAGNPRNVLFQEIPNSINKGYIKGVKKLHKAIVNGILYEDVTRVRRGVASGWARGAFATQ